MNEIADSSQSIREMNDQNGVSSNELFDNQYLTSIEEEQFVKENILGFEETQLLRRESQKMISSEDQEYERDDDDELSDDEKEVNDVIEKAEKVLDKINDFLDGERITPSSSWTKSRPPKFPIEKLISVLLFTILVAYVYVYPPKAVVTIF